MGTIAEKLTYLNGTKSSLKTAINNLGGAIDSNTTFRAYASELDTIYDNLPKISDTGTNVSLSPTLKGRLGIVPKGNTLQDGTPTPETPVEIQTATGTQKVVVSGKNLFNQNSDVETSYNASATPLSNGVRITTTTETATGFCSYRIGGSELLGKTLTFRTDITKSGDNPARARLFYGNPQNVYHNQIADKSTNTSVTVTLADTFPEGDNGIYLLLYATFSNNQSAGVYVDYTNIQLEKGNSATSYQPYQEPQEVDIELSSKNLFDKDNTVVGWIRSNNGTINPESGSHTSNFIKIKPNTNYIRTTREGNAFYNENKEFISYTYGNNYETPNNAKYIRITVTDVNINQEQLEEGTTATDYTPYYNYTPNKIGDYEDYIDGTPDNWVLYKNIGKKAPNLTSSSVANLYMDNTTFNKQYKIQQAYSNCFQNVINTNITDNNTAGNLLNENQFSFRWGNENARDRLYIKSSLTLAQIQSLNIELLYVLAEPEPTPITDTNLISQLNELYYLQSYNDTTNIDVTGNLPMRITASAIKGA